MHLLSRHPPISSFLYRPLLPSALVEFSRPLNYRLICVIPINHHTLVLIQPRRVLIFAQIKQLLLEGPLSGRFRASRVSPLLASFLTLSQVLKQLMGGNIRFLGVLLLLLRRADPLRSLRSGTLGGRMG
jgi:hypothetical protein